MFNESTPLDYFLSDFRKVEMDCVCTSSVFDKFFYLLFIFNCFFFSKDGELLRDDLARLLQVKTENVLNEENTEIKRMVGRND